MLIAGVSLIALGGFAYADDHLFQAEHRGLSADGNAITHTHAFTENPAGHSGDDGAGQGSPFAGEDTHTPSSDHGAEHTTVKERRP